jgi:hypothetical protein
MQRIISSLLLIAAWQASLTGAAIAKGDSKSLLVGGWALSHIECESDNSIIYSKDGTWSHYNEGGTWSLEGDQLTLRVTERGGYDEDPVRKVREKPSTSKVLSLTKSELVQRAGRRTWALRRCPVWEAGAVQAPR